MLPKIDTLTKIQYQVLLILLDNEGHPGWELAEKLHMKESNLNAKLKKLRQDNFIIKGLPRKSEKPKTPLGSKSDVGRRKRRDGDYSELPYYLSNDLTILEKIIKALVVTNRSNYDEFPFRKIEKSEYMKSMKDKFKADFIKMGVQLSRENFIDRPMYSHMIESPNIEIAIAEGQKELHFLNYDGEDSPSEDEVVTKESLKDLEVWWVRYNLTICRDQDPVDIKEILRIVSEDVPEGYKIGDDIKEVIISEASKMPDL